MLQAIKTLSIEELEILTFLTLEEHSQKELAERWGCSQRAISKKFQKIKKVFPSPNQGKGPPLLPRPHGSRPGLSFPGQKRMLRP